MKKRKLKRTKRQVKMGTTMIGIVVMALCGAITCKCVSLRKELKALDEKSQMVEKQIQEQEAISEQLSEQEKYMETKSYVEDVAHEKLGLVYPDEIFITPSDDE